MASCNAPPETQQSSAFSTPAPSCSVVINAERYVLAERPSGRVLASARDVLLSQIDLASFTNDILSVARVVHVGQAASLQAGCTDLASDISALARRVAALFRSSCSTIGHFDETAQDVLSELPKVATLLQDVESIDTAISLIERNDSRALNLAEVAETLSKDLLQASDEANAALMQAQTHRGSCEERKRTIDGNIDRLNVKKSGAWEQHALSLQVLTKTSQEYVMAVRRERAAQRRENVHRVAFGFLEKLDRVLQQQLSIDILQPVSNSLRSMREHTEAASEERKAILQCKVEQRRVHALALEGVTEASKAIRDASVELDVVGATIDALSGVTSELARLSAQISRVAEFWRSVHASMNRLSSREVVKLVHLTKSKARKPRQQAESSRVGRVAGSTPDPQVKELGDGEMSRLISSEYVPTEHLIAGRTSDVWELPVAVRKRFVSYYAQWAAVADICGECVDSLGDMGSSPEVALCLHNDRCTKATGDMVSSGLIRLVATGLPSEVRQRGSGMEDEDVGNSSGEETGSVASDPLTHASPSTP